MKRQAAEYNAIPFNYDEIGPKVSSEALEEPEEVDTTPFESKLELPPDVEPPDTLKQHQIIEKTAKFIASQGPQMEILLKTKQASNSQFNFLSHDGKYNVYYKHILSLIKAGTYQFHAENETKKDEEDNQKEENGSVEEPQPSTSVIVIPKLAFKPSADCAYTQLISKITKAPISAIEQKQKEQEANTANGSTGIKSLGLLASYCSDSEDSQDDEEDSNYSGSIPSTEIQIVIDKTALYVAKNGRDFEETLRKKNDSRFQFLIPNDEFHAYYLFKVNESRKSLPSSAPATTVSATTKMDTKKTSESHVTETAKSKVPPAPVSFSIKPKDEKSQLRSKPFDETAKNANKSQSPNKISVEEELEMQVDVMNAEREERLAKEKLKGKLFDAARKNLVGMPKDKILQIERKKKALMFVNQIKGKVTDPLSCRQCQSERFPREINSNTRRLTFNFHTFLMSISRLATGSHSNGGGNGNGNNEVINLTTGNDDDSDSSVKSIPISSSARGKRLSRSRSRLVEREYNELFKISFTTIFIS